MPTPRSQQISLIDTPYYHCVSRCVRRAYLCGKDKHSGQCFEHRRGWVEQRLHLLAKIFCIDVCAYAVMSNHTHVVLHINKDKAQSLSDKEIISRWHRLFNGTLLTQQYMQEDEENLAPWFMHEIKRIAAVYRQRLHDISWFMRCLNEHIAREANKEDNCTGRFWEGRFKSQALLDEAALAACMAYVDLNPIRAKMATSPESSIHTSIHLRIKALLKGEQPKTLMPFAGNPRQPMSPGLPFQLTDYIELVEATGKEVRHNKRGKLDDNSPPILSRLGLESEQWLTLTTEFESLFTCAVGGEAMLREFGQHTKRKHINGISASRQWLQTG
ncbi:transposase [Aestuariibacter sp. AA17]|uniref:Transposase n=1 Tax=Fluctibacter corallii TaxID=2984329 RepID=A0ABT3A7V3_9ALTE|nr:transposase [Aestuariibacter sp. AA17]MCV2884760.1 transposase [Aestuariibacter sp. AA17]